MNQSETEIHLSYTLKSLAEENFFYAAVGVENIFVINGQSDGQGAEGEVNSND